MIYLTIWHYIAIVLVLFMFIGGVFVSFKQENKKQLKPMLISVTLVSLVLVISLMFIIDKYTKHPELHRIKSRRVPSIDRMIYSGIVKNAGDYTIGEVTLDIKLVNLGKRAGVESTTFYKSSGFLDIISGLTKKLKTSNTLEKDFVIAKDLKAGQARSFQIHFKYPENFGEISEHTSVYGH